MKILLLLAIWVLVVGVYADESSWNNFKIKNNKVYKNQADLEQRQKIFNDNLQSIEEHNKKYEQGLVSYKLGINQFSDLTDEEFGALFKTLEADEKVLQGGLKNVDLTEAIPDEIDWRTKSVVTPVKNQESCGGCWAFSATGTLESQVAIQTGELKSFSEQELIDCDVAINLGCNGGVVQYAYDYVKKNGLTLEGNYSYQGAQGICRRSSTRNPVVWTKGYVNIIGNDETDLKQAVGLIGPVSVAINSVPIKSYQEGIFDGVCSNALDHAVLAVGYGKDTNGVEYWIIKNSWGPEWGDQGYFKLKMGTNLCGVAKQACYPILEKSDGSTIRGGIASFLVLGIYLFLY